VGQRKDLTQFLNEIALSLPPTIKVSGAVFGDASDYILRTQYDSSFRHDLLLGADIEDTGPIVSLLKQQTQRSKVPGIVLIKEDDKPKLCQVKYDSGAFSCTAL
jgi:hypothetical protein